MDSKRREEKKNVSKQANSAAYQNMKIIPFHSFFLSFLLTENLRPCANCMCVCVCVWAIDRFAAKHCVCALTSHGMWKETKAFFCAIKKIVYWSNVSVWPVVFWVRALHMCKSLNLHSRCRNSTIKLHELTWLCQVSTLTLTRIGENTYGI